jgi:hypothetical protein
MCIYQLIMPNVLLVLGLSALVFVLRESWKQAQTISRKWLTLYHALNVVSAQTYAHQKPSL